MKKPLSSNPIPRFLLLLLVAMPCCMAIWWFWLRDILVLTLFQAADILTQWTLADKIVSMSTQIDTQSEQIVWVLNTSLSPINDPKSLLSIPISTNRFTVSFPLLWGLILATPGNDKAKQLISGTFILVPITLMIAYLLIHFKLALSINHQAILTEIPTGQYLLALPYTETVYYLLAVGRQLAMLVLPTLSPLLVWGFFNRQFIRTVIFEGLLSRMEQATISKPPGQ